MAELTGLEVDRVDGVDRPATKRQFLIVKAEGDGAAGGAAGEGDGVAAAKKLIAAAARALGGVHATKSEFPADVADALNELAELAAVPAETRFTKAAAPAAAAPAAGQPIDPEAFALSIAKAVGAEVKKALTEEVANAVANDDETIVGKGEPIETSGAVRETITTTTPPPSAQPAGQTPITKSAGPRKNGEGMFGNLVFGK